ncbi:MAG: DUF2970 domain-containing protein [Gammaproteobacteria bacterium]|nr:MAG: DUF2970 domain-containing protein [Gammaproteobacteria bacterium]
MSDPEPPAEEAGTSAEEAGTSAEEAGTSAEEADEKPLSFLQVVGSGISAAFGVQSSHNRERDFARGKPWHFIAVGIGLTILFVVMVIVVVNLVLSNVS